MPGCCTGILKAFLGLSASIGTAIYTGYFAPQALDFLAFLALGPAALAACTIPFLNHVPHTQRSEAAPDAFGFTSSEWVWLDPRSAPGGAGVAGEQLAAARLQPALTSAAQHLLDGSGLWYAWSTPALGHCHPG